MRVLLILLLASPLAAQGEWLSPFVEPKLEHHYVRLQTGGGYDSNPHRSREPAGSAFLDGRGQGDGLWEFEPLRLYADGLAALRRPLSEPDATTWGLTAHSRAEVAVGDSDFEIVAGVDIAGGWERRAIYDIFDLPTRQRDLRLAGVQVRSDFSLRAAAFGFTMTFWSGYHFFSREETPRRWDPSMAAFPLLERPRLQPLDYNSLGGLFWLKFCFIDAIEVGPYFWVESRSFTEHLPIGGFGLPDDGEMVLTRIEFGTRLQIVFEDWFKLVTGWHVKQGYGGGSEGSDAISFIGGGWRVGVDLSFEPITASFGFDWWTRSSNVGHEFNTASHTYIDLRGEVRGRPTPWLEIGANAQLYAWDVGEHLVGYEGWEAQLFVAVRF